jgi:hypothetical protein
LQSLLNQLIELGGVGPAGLRADRTAAQRSNLGRTIRDALDLLQAREGGLAHFERARRVAQVLCDLALLAFEIQDPAHCARIVLGLEDSLPRRHLGLQLRLLGAKLLNLTNNPFRRRVVCESHRKPS